MSFFKNSKKKMEVLLKTQENLEALQGNLEVSQNNVVVSQDNLKASQDNLKTAQENIEALFVRLDKFSQNMQTVYSEEEKQRADYALSLLEASKNNLEASRGNLEVSQRNIETLFVQPEIPTQNTQLEYSEEEKRRAAYALNLCMVSVSQIIDYDDIYILEQEYDAILNNLNIEFMPKDEALLDILKQLLNTITFFRIQEGDKVFIEREYQQRMKDAIWSAVPNFGVLVTGGSLISGAICLATQVGIGYMNYRKEKAKIKFENEKQQWQLQRSAMEQFNGLRRELFDTAWRLADKYNFPDEYRITERQITQYNEIILDSNYLRRYERLDYIKDKFEAYPPFLYFLGNAANMVSQDENITDISIRSKYRALAMQHFQCFLDRTEKNLMREDQLLASCALEYFDLLVISGNRDVDFLASLLKRAISATNSLDVLELVAFSYGKIGKVDEAAKILRMLVNEDYNAVVNAQILTYLYVRQYLQYGSKDAYDAYQTLGVGFDKKLLFPLPSSNERNEHGLIALNNSFISFQRDRIHRKYTNIMEDFCNKYIVAFNRTIPLPGKEVDNPNWYFSDDPYAKSIRQNDVAVIFERSSKANEYITKLAESHFESKMIDVLNDLYAAMLKLPCVKGNARLMEEIQYRIKEDISASQEKFNDLLTKIGNRSFSANNIPVLFSFELSTFARNAFTLLTTALKNYISSANSMDVIAKMESELKYFCDSENLTYPEMDDFSDETAGTAVQVNDKPFNIGLFGERAKLEMKRAKKSLEMLNTIIEYASRILVPDAAAIEFNVKDEVKFNSYIQRNKHINQDKTLAIINDTSASDEDWIFTTEGIYRFKGVFGFKHDNDMVEYRNVKVSRDRKLTLQIGKNTCSDSKRINLEEFNRLAQALAEIEARYKNSL